MEEEDGKMIKEEIEKEWVGRAKKKKKKILPNFFWFSLFLGMLCVFF